MHSLYTLLSGLPVNTVFVVFEVAVLLAAFWLICIDDKLT